jgi:hypothetical protein
MGTSCVPGIAGGENSPPGLEWLLWLPLSPSGTLPVEAVAIPGQASDHSSLKAGITLQQKGFHDHSPQPVE